MTPFALAKVVRGDVLFPPRLARLSNGPQELWVTGRLPDDAPSRPEGPLFEMRNVPRRTPVALGPSIEEAISEEEAFTRQGVEGVSPGAAGVVASRLAAGLAVAIVGSRAASAEGCAFARQLGSTLAQAGIAVISGGAYGIDAAAHEGALSGRGATFAVLGCGVDVIYPDCHADLFARIAVAGGLLSQYPPGTPPRRGQFPVRNRIIAALSDLVVVVEAAHRSGALGTAKLASGLGVPVAAWAGSGGTDGLIGRGRTFPLHNPADVFAVLAGRATLPGSAGSAIADRGGARPRADRGEARSPRVQSLLGTLAGGPAGADELALRLGWRVSEVLGVVGEAEIEGWIRRVPGGAYEVTRGH